MYAARDEEPEAGNCPDCRCVDRPCGVCVRFADQKGRGRRRASRASRRWYAGADRSASGRGTCSARVSTRCSSRGSRHSCRRGRDSAAWPRCWQAGRWRCGRWRCRRRRHGCGKGEPGSNAGVHDPHGDSWIRCRCIQTASRLSVDDSDHATDLPAAFEVGGRRGCLTFCVG